MPLAPLKPHVITIGGVKTSVKLPDYYGEFGTILGITEVSEANNPVQGSTVKKLIQSGQAVRIVARYKDGIKIKSVRLLCDIEKASAAVNTIVTKSFQGKPITSATIPTRSRNTW